MYKATLGTVSTGGDWLQTVRVRDKETGDPFDLTGTSITIKVQRDKQGSSPVLTGTIASGHVTNPEAGIIQWTFRQSEITALCAGTYNIGCVISKDGDTIQLILGTVQIIKGL